MLLINEALAEPSPNYLFGHINAHHAILYVLQASGGTAAAAAGGESSSSSLNAKRGNDGRSLYGADAVIGGSGIETSPYMNREEDDYLTQGQPPTKRLRSDDSDDGRGSEVGATSSSIYCPVASEREGSYEGRGRVIEDGGAKDDDGYGITYPDEHLVHDLEVALAVRLLHNIDKPQLKLNSNLCNLSSDIVN